MPTQSYSTQIFTESVINVSSLKSYLTQLLTEVIYPGISTKSYSTQLFSEVIYAPNLPSRTEQLLNEVIYSKSADPSIPVGSQTSGSYQSTITAETNLQSYWKFDETSGTTLADSKGTNTGTSHSGCTLNQTSITSLGKCIKFDGTTNAYISTANTLSSLTTFTYELWFNITALPTQANNSALLAGFTTTAGNRDCCLFIDYRGYLCFFSGSLASLIGGGIVYLPLNFPILNIWRHVAVVFTAVTSVKIYLDGNLIFSINYGVNLGTFNFKIGGDDTNNAGLFGFFNGYIDEPALYNIALSQSTIQSHITTSILGTSPYSLNTQSITESVFNTNSISNVSQIFTESVLNTTGLKSQTTHILTEVIYPAVATKSYLTQIIKEIIYISTISSRTEQLLNEVIYQKATDPTPPVGSQTSGTYQSVILAETGLQSYYKLDETSGTTIADSKGSNTGTSHSGCTLNQTSITSLNTCIKFDGTTNAFISTTSSLTYTNHSFEFWIKVLAYPPASTNAFVVGLASGGNGSFLYLDSNGYLTWFGNSIIGASNTVKLIPALSLNRWFHIVASFAANSIANIYLDGVLLVTTTATAFGFSTQFFIGGSSGTGQGYFNGYLDEVALYNIALTQTTILSHLTPAILGTSPYSVASQSVIETVYSPQSGIAIIKKTPIHLFQLILGQGIG